MIKKLLILVLCILLSCVFVINAHASTQMISGVRVLNIYNADDLIGSPILMLNLGDSIKISQYSKKVMAVLGYNDAINGYCDKNNLIYSDTLYFAEPGVMVSATKYSQLIDSAKYNYIFKVEGLEFVKNDSHPVLIQQSTYFKLMNLASALNSLGYRTEITRAYLYTDENGTQDYATGCRLDFSIYSGNTKINIPLSEYDENGEIVSYSELEQIFVDNGFVRIETSETFLDVDFENFLAYEVNFDTLSYVIMD